MDTAVMFGGAIPNHVFLASLHHYADLGESERAELSKLPPQALIEHYDAVSVEAQAGSIDK